MYSRIVPDGPKTDPSWNPHPRAIWKRFLCYLLEKSPLQITLRCVCTDFLNLPKLFLKILHFNFYLMLFLPNFYELQCYSSVTQTLIFPGVKPFYFLNAQLFI